MKRIGVGLIGIGNMGSAHLLRLAKKEIPGAELVAVCDTNPDRLAWAKQEVGDGVRIYETDQEFFSDPGLEAVVIATPHYDHPPLAIKAFARGMHVLIEKPAGVYTKQVQEMNEMAAASGKVFGIMFQMRTVPVHQRLRQIVTSGEIGEIKRTNWITTKWYRSQAYYDSGGWRATWAGEGGGVLLNQCPHNLDLWQWICGVPTLVRGFCGYGRYRNIEVEDDVTAYVEYENGGTGVFVACTSDAPGTDRLEITGDRGKVVLENGKLQRFQLSESEKVFNQTNTEVFKSPEHKVADVVVDGEATQHAGILTNWLEAIHKGTELIAPGTEGIKGLQISNAIHLSSWLQEPVQIPVDADRYYELLQERIKGSTFKKNVTDGKGVIKVLT